MDAGKLRERAQQASSHARLTTDPAIKAQWQALVDQYRVQLDELGDKPVKPRKPQIGIGAKRPPPR